MDTQRNELMCGHHPECDAFKGILIGKGDERRAERAQALDLFLKEIEGKLKDGQDEEAMVLIGRLRKFSSWVRDVSTSS